jgi:hypothetical protein
MGALKQVIRSSLLLAIFSPTLASASMMKSVPRMVISVSNSTTETLRCKVQINGKGWVAVDFPAGAELARRSIATIGGNSMSCSPPVKSAIFRLVPGKRYVFVRWEKEIDLVQVAN